jgi:hypothetical protein
MFGFDLPAGAAVLDEGATDATLAAAFAEHDIACISIATTTSPVRS